MSGPAPLSTETRVHRSFPLLTDGNDDELDAMSIIIEVMGGLQGDQVRRILQYLLARYTIPGAKL